MAEWTVDPADEGRHPFGQGQFWQESVYLDFVDAAGDVGGYVRIGVYPNLGVTWWTTAVVRRGEPAALSVAYDLPVLRDGGFDLDSDTVHAAYDVVAALESVRVRAEADAQRFAAPSDVYARRPSGDDELAVDLTWRTDGEAYHYGLTTRYEVPCDVEGTVRVGAVEYEVAGYGQRDHSWGERDWWTFGWSWVALRMDDGQRLHGAHIRLPGFPALGYEQRQGAVAPLRALSVTEVEGDARLPLSGVATFEPGGTVELAPIAFAPLLLVAPDGRTSSFPRAMVAARGGDGTAGTGWIEWNQPAS